MIQRTLFSVLLLAAGVVAANDIKLTCWIVCDNKGRASRTEESISNLVEEVNNIYAQVCMRFAIDSISTTNSTYLSNAHPTNYLHWAELCSISRNTGGLELYFVREHGGDATAFHTAGGIVVGPDANGRSVAHEIGHACGLPDIYEVSEDGSLFVTGKPTRKARQRLTSPTATSTAYTTRVRGIASHGNGMTTGCWILHPSGSSTTATVSPSAGKRA